MGWKCEGVEGWGGSEGVEGWGGCVRVWRGGVDV